MTPLEFLEDIRANKSELFHYPIYGGSIEFHYNDHIIFIHKKSIEYCIERYPKINQLYRVRKIKDILK